MNRFWLGAGLACADEKEWQSALRKRRFYGAAHADAGRKRPAGRVRLRKEAHAMGVRPRSRRAFSPIGHSRDLQCRPALLRVSRSPWDELHGSLRTVAARPRAICRVAFLANGRAIGKKRRLAAHPDPHHHRRARVMQVII
jgi:hypothetical protein